ncbi:hypothetical protein BX265_5649 [Streptomyces sp. TLI_235]|nr:hypothetical protein BX265_5649 [Streptomyces sp. TLI_235]
MPLALLRIRMLAAGAALGLVVLIGSVGLPARAVAASAFPLPGTERDGPTYPTSVYRYDSADALNTVPEPKAADLLPIGPKELYEHGTREHMLARWKAYDKKGLTWEKFRTVFATKVFREPDVLDDVPMPSDQVLQGIGIPKQYTWASLDFMYAHWKIQKEGSGVADWTVWRAGYVNAANSRRKGEAFEQLVRQEYIEKEKPLKGGEWQFNKRVPRDKLPLLSGLGLNKADRPLDAADFDRLKVILEMKSGKNVNTKEGRKQFEDLMKIAKATGCRLIVAFGEEPTEKSHTVIRGLAAQFGVQTDVRYFPAIGQKVTPKSGGGTPPPTQDTGGAPVTPVTPGPSGGPSGGPAGDAATPQVLAAPGQMPADSPMDEAVEASADSLQDAIRTGLIQGWQDEELAAEGGDTSSTTQPDLGGVDFSTLQLRYVSDTYHNGSGVQYAFKADKPTTDEQSFGGRRAARLASDSFFVWLELPPSAFTVNLNPDEPDRIIDAQFGRTDAGRVLLEADLAMKKLVAKFIHPDTPGGRTYWDSLQGDTKCLSMRQWIVPDTATVRDNGAELYILDAPLLVKMETDVIKTQGVGDAAGCTQQDKATTRYNETVYRTTILPQVQDAVNHAPEFADLRRVYASRVAAEWFRQRSATKHTAYSDLIGKGDIGRWTSRQPWTPREVFDRYVQSYKNGEFNVTHTTAQGDTVRTHTYVYGGVDFSRINQNRLSADAFAKEHPAAAASAHDALYGPSGAGHEVWLGGLTSSKPLPEAYARPAPATSNPLFYALVPLPLIAWLVGGGALLRRRRALAPTEV